MTEDEAIDLRNIQLCLCNGDYKTIKADHFERMKKFYDRLTVSYAQELYEKKYSDYRKCN